MMAGEFRKWSLIYFYDIESWTYSLAFFMLQRRKENTIYSWWHFETYMSLFILDPFVLKTIDAMKMKTAFLNFIQSIENEKNHHRSDCFAFDLLWFSD
jgi:hypothetical protein